MNLSDIEKLKATLENNHKANMAAIERFRAKMQEAATRSMLLARAPQLKEKMSKIVDRIITSWVGNFEIADISRKYTETTGRQSSANIRREISNCINKLKHRNPPEIIEVKKGEGSRSGIYKMSAN
jgi:glutamyl-tRNA reductase